ncbi:peroxide stress protein YaaA [Corynebacterium felinum]|uniref:Cytoplasmic iron level regulating protein YaaA (DUF328/UPF0246 family) n=1 Tax=Corynebacterium felinum TaxID=131318 RepID=A0ABU2BBJ0_9CORY|nr:peroxide stress protein YaaA [Corynebacterium felinum]MDF5819899.1 peroxide stress protein YaaA [Corynebacterium felinum]MDR7355958.1 cytoplasmic iron level regulating protein YaaA (DUF328/UPF0246 family) [Corynebacterium felinum]WJY95294.1 hypothetical protein CFELI_08445 [Corynebacterium felinum]
MLIILPPSETKAHGGLEAPLDFDTLSFPSLNPVRRSIAADLAALDVDQALDVLGISEKLRAEAESNRALFSSPTMPAILRFTGVLYDALDAHSLSRDAWSRLAVGDALFGIVMATDLIPHYRLSGGTKLPEHNSTATAPTMKKRWGKAITEALSAYEGLIIDMRSGTYQQLGKIADAVTIRVESVQPDGSRKVVSHFNKHYKGILARVLAESPVEAHTIDDLCTIATQAGLVIEHNGTRELTLVVTP